MFKKLKTGKIHCQIKKIKELNNNCSEVSEKRSCPPVILLSYYSIKALKNEDQEKLLMKVLFINNQDFIQKNTHLHEAVIVLKNKKNLLT